MKKIMLFICLLSTSVFSQSNFSLQVGGISSNFKSQSNTVKDSYLPLLSYSINAVLYYKVQNINLVFEPGYIGKGAKFVTTGDVARIGLNYLNFPICAEIPISHPFYLGFGFEFAYFLSASYEDSKYKQVFNSGFKNSSSSIASLILKPSNRVSLILRYNYGITHIYKDKDYSLRNNYFLMGLRYKLKNG